MKFDVWYSKLMRVQAARILQYTDSGQNSPLATLHLVYLFHLAPLCVVFFGLHLALVIPGYLSYFALVLFPICFLQLHYILSLVPFLLQFYIMFTYPVWLQSCSSPTCPMQQSCILFVCFFQFWLPLVYPLFDFSCIFCLFVWQPRILFSRFAWL